jgi:hypothetical protein
MYSVFATFVSQQVFGRSTVVNIQQRAVILLKMSIRTFIDAPASSTKDWPARNK